MWVQKSHNWTPCLGWSQTSPAKLPCTHLPPHLWNQLSAENTPDSCDLVTQSTLLNQEPVGANSWDAQAALRTLSFPSPNITPPPPKQGFRLTGSTEATIRSSKQRKIHSSLVKLVCSSYHLHQKRWEGPGRVGKAGLLWNQTQTQMNTFVEGNRRAEQWSEKQDVSLPNHCKQ